MIDHSIKLSKIFLSGDEQASKSYIEETLSNNNRLLLYEDLLTPTMIHIGKLWECNEISVADEHLATAVCDYVISDYEFRMVSSKPFNHKKVMLFGAEGEEHYIGLKMAAAVFKEFSWTVRYLGPNLPLQHAETAVNAWKPDVIAMTAALSYRLPKLKESVKVLANTEHAPTIIIGGRIAPHVMFDMEAAPEQVIVMPTLRRLHDWLEHASKGADTKNVVS
ncbi:cobalamin B12-binding domain-containing protein [Sporosarcina sp. Sa2YVA2]|uniref:Cobalamin B12-binding domain-containing protein n=1 Tax=Sporosarcina quadrami TaxID=2762234 RepID=A0ABR8UA58_9BACL|nr:cobalamin B12-binding domain-containing protein [Sporosarcina quadrami]MBD7984918.1 cobalamin B12-binding domain-containing protein [Sporosarcina quadrami]